MDEPLLGPSPGWVAPEVSPVLPGGHVAVRERNRLVELSQIVGRPEFREQERRAGPARVPLGEIEHALLLSLADRVLDPRRQPRHSRRGGHAVRVEAEADGRIAEVLVMGVGAVVEEHVGLVEDEPRRLDCTDRAQDACEKALNAPVEAPGPTRPQAADRGGAGKRLVEDVVGEYRGLCAEASRHVPPRCGVAILQSDAARAAVVRPEVVVGAPQRAHHYVVAGEPDVRPGPEAVVLDRPVGKALAVEALVEHVLMEVEQHARPASPSTATVAAIRSRYASS